MEWSGTRRELERALGLPEFCQTSYYIVIRKGNTARETGRVKERVLLGEHTSYFTDDS